MSFHSHMGTKIYNSDLTREIREGAKIQTSSDPTPGELSEKVLAVMEVNPKLLRNTDFFTSRSESSTGGTMTTTPTDRDTFITTLMMSVQKDVTSTLTNYSVRCTVNGVVIQLGNMAFLSLTTANQTATITFPNPIKVDRGTNITTTFTGGGTATHLGLTTITGFQVININS